MFENLIIGLILSFVSFLLAPKPQPPKAATLDDIDVPVTKEGTEIGVAYGTVWIDSPQIVWYGDFEAIPIRSRSGKK